MLDKFYDLLNHEDTKLHNALCFSVPLCLCGSKNAQEIITAQECDATEVQ